MRRGDSMKLLLALMACLTILPQISAAQDFTNSQSSPSLSWKSIENNFVKVIYPEEFRPKAVYVANLIEHYSSVVGLNYGIKKPKKVTLIIRNEMALPNGFVTRGPRRTEWFNAGAYSPFVGSLEWLQILSIHEYRHVQQQDDFNKHTVKFFDYLFGDMGITLLDALAKKSWMAEGDAVYAETRYSDGGRGRSPRFLARLKGILLAGETPTYDQFVNGTYRDALVNQYVYGYILISNAYQIYGDEVWERLTDKVAHAPTPFRIESAFKELTGDNFRDFYYETFEELRKAWSKDTFKDLPKTEYTLDFNPKATGKNIYFVRSDLNTLPAIYKSTPHGTERIVEVPYSEDLTRIDFFEDSAVYTDYVRDPRYGFKSSADLVLADLSKGTLKYITSDHRLYNPKFSQDGKNILAAEFTNKMTWNIQEFSRNGDRQRTLHLAGLDLIEAAPLNKDEFVAIAISKTGQKALIQAQFGSDKYKTLLPFSRNNIFSVQANSQGEVLFEAQYKGATEIIHLRLSDNKFAQCTTSKISAYAPTFVGSAFYYSEETPYGARTQKAELSSCAPMEASALVDYNYLGDNPSDNYNKFERMSFADQEKLYTANADKYKEEDYDSIDSRGFIPHSWSFLGGRGLSLGVTTDNYLRDFGSHILIGSDGEENTPFTSVQIDFKKYWPVLSLLGDIRNRSSQVMGTTQDLTWREGSYGLGVTLPYFFKNHLYSGQIQIGYSGKVLKTESFRLNEVSVPGSRASTYLDQQTTLLFAYQKAAPTRALQSPLGFTAHLLYEDVSGVSSEEAPGSYRTFGELTLYLPSFIQNHGIRLTGSGQTNRDGVGNYIFPTPIFNPVGYVYSRGFEYKPADSFTKGSFEYLFPFSYPDYNLGAWIYFKRLYANVYFDHTKYTIASADTDLNSYGAELIAQTMIFRTIPIDFGWRYIQKVDPSEGEGEVFLGTNLTVF